MHREGKFFAVEKNYSTVKKKQKRGHVIYMMATFLMVKKKRKRKLPCDWRIGQENWKRQMIRKIHLQFQISASSLLIYSWYPRISGNSWPCLRKHRLSVQVQKLIVAVIGEAFPRPTFVSNFIATIDSAPAVFAFYFSHKSPLPFFILFFLFPSLFFNLN